MSKKPLLPTSNDVRLVNGSDISQTLRHAGDKLRAAWKNFGAKGHFEISFSESGVCCATLPAQLVAYRGQVDYRDRAAVAAAQDAWLAELARRGFEVGAGDDDRAVQLLDTVNNRELLSCALKELLPSATVSETKNRTWADHAYFGASGTNRRTLLVSLTVYIREFDDLLGLGGEILEDDDND